MLIDGVFSGGGIKGFAYIGALQVLEERRFRFKRVAGTSAGAIIACLVAAGYSAKEMEGLLDELDLKALLDPPKLAKRIPILKWWNAYFRLGLYKGVELENWFYNKLAAKGVVTFNDLPEGSLKLVASDLTNGRMVVIPDDLEYYGVDWKTFTVAKALRMSCGLPFFFEPVKLSDDKGECIIVDGGVLSNFPYWIFDDENDKKVRPLIGLKLSNPYDLLDPQKIKNGLNLFEAMIETMQNAHDTRYVSRKHEKDIIFIPVEHYKTTQFDLKEETKQTLMDIGRKRAELFLENWQPGLRPLKRII